MQTLDISSIFEPYPPQDIASHFEEVFDTSALSALFFYKRHLLSEQQRRSQKLQNLPEITFLERKKYTLS